MGGSGQTGASAVAVDGGNASSYSGNIEAYNAKKNTWSELTADPTPREPGCSAVIKGDLYVAGGDNGSNLTLNQSYNPKTKAWTTLAPMPQGIDDTVALQQKPVADSIASAEAAFRAPPTTTCRFTSRKSGRAWVFARDLKGARSSSAWVGFLLGFVLHLEKTESRASCCNIPITRNIKRRPLCGRL